MTLTVQQTTVQAGKSESTIRKWIKSGKIKAHKQGQAWQIDQASLEKYLAGNGQAQAAQNAGLDNATIAKIATEVVSQIKPVIQAAITDGQAEDYQEEIDKLRQENTSLSEQVSRLAMEVEALKACVNDLLHQQSKPKPESQAQPEQAEAEGSQEDELKQDLAWLDKPCHFKKAVGRTWRQLAMNYGEKISMNGKGRQSPRSYLHAIESWQECKMAARVKARIALEVGKIDNGSHYSHSAEVGG